MPYGYAGHCYATTENALDAFVLSFPWQGQIYIVNQTSSSISAGGLITYAARAVDLKGGFASTYSGATIQLATCATVDTVPAFDPVAAGGVFAFFFLGVAMTWVLSQNIGLILEAIKKW